MSPLRLTKWGEFVNLHSVMTAPDFWKKARREIDRVADQDGDWELMVDERIRGLQELRDRYYEFSNEAS